MEVRGLRGEDKFIPHLLGHEGTGVVVEIGNGVKKVKPGDRVILGWLKGTGMDVLGAKYDHQGEIISSGGVTTFSDYTIVSENRCSLLPSGVPMDIGVLFGCALPTGGGIVLNQLSPLEDSSIAVLGLGGIGLSALMMAAAFKPKHLIGVDISDDKLGLASSFGATHTINAKSDVHLEMQKITDGKMLDFCVEASGDARVIELGFDLIRRGGGQLVFASHPKAGEKISIDPFELINGKMIKGSWGGGSQPDIDIPKFADFYLQGKLTLEKIFTKRYTLEQVNDALDDLENHRVNRPLLVIDKTLA